MVSNISMGAGSVAVSRTSRLAEHRSHLGKLLMMRSCVCSSSVACVTDIPGGVAGM